MTDLLSLMRRPIIRVPYDESKPMLRGPAKRSEILPHPRMAWHIAEIHAHPFAEGWAWCVKHMLTNSGAGYWLSARHGRFAHDEHDAVSYAVDELAANIAAKGFDPVSKKITAWLATVHP